jgi:hypothetical protein
MKVTDPNILTRLIHERLPGNWGNAPFASMTTPSR